MVEHPQMNPHLSSLLHHTLMIAENGPPLIPTLLEPLTGNIRTDYPDRC